MYSSAPKGTIFHTANIKRFGVCVQQPAYCYAQKCVVDCLHAFVKNDYLCSPNIYFLTHGYYPPPLWIPSFQIAECWAMEIPMIATDFTTAQFLTQTLSNTQRYFYSWNLDWLYSTRPSHKELDNVYNNPNIHLIARCKEHARLLKQCWKEPIDTIEEFNYDGIKQLLNY